MHARVEREGISSPRIKNEKLIGIGAIAALLLGAGYAFGARKVHSLEEQIAAIKRESDEASSKLKKSQDEIAVALKERDAQYARQAKQLEAAQKTKDLSAALAGANQRVASLQAQVSVVDARRAKLVADQDKSTAAERQKPASLLAACGEPAAVKPGVTFGELISLSARDRDSYQACALKHKNHAEALAACNASIEKYNAEIREIKARNAAQQ